MLLCSHSIAGKFPYPPKREQPMSEAKPQDGSTVKGYRTLSVDDIAQMNDLKEISRDFCEKLDLERTHLSLQVVEANSEEASERSEALRCLAIARTKMQEACMWACRAVARPDADC
ncbi:hypothetical protein AI2796V1_1818 [Enterobacter cloacae]|nr:hypothetical protein AI2796V1_1818 [Enterobacter cloacae]CAH3704862.1 hypothetical protein AI2796V1_1818 [Enterobacter cloacae]